jgi:hypothetical protein
MSVDREPPLEGPPRVSVARYAFFRGARWTEVAPSSSLHFTEWGCTPGVSKPPEGTPVQQELRFAWDDCVVDLSLPGEVTGAVALSASRRDLTKTPLRIGVTFRRAGDAEAWIGRLRNGEGADDPGDHDHAFFIFEDQRDEIKVEIAVPGFGLVGFVLLSLFRGNQVDVSRLREGTPSEIVDLSKITPDQVWIYQGLFGQESMRILDNTYEAQMIRSVLALPRIVLTLARVHLLEVHRSIEDVREALCHEEGLLRALSDLRTYLAPLAFVFERTDLLRLAREMEAEAAADRSVRGVRW